MSWQYNPAMRFHPNKMAPHVARGSVQAGFIGGNQTKRQSRANALRTTKKLEPIVYSASEQRRREKIALATPPTEPIVIAQSRDANNDSLPIRIEPRSLRIERGQDVKLEIALDGAEIAAVEWRAYTPSTDEWRIVRNKEKTMSDAPLADTVYSILFQVHERNADRRSSQQVPLVGHHYQVHVHVNHNRFEN